MKVKALLGTNTDNWRGVFVIEVKACQGTLCATPPPAATSSSTDQ